MCDLKYSIVSGLQLRMVSLLLVLVAKSNRSSYLDGRVQGELALNGVEVAGVDVAKANGNRFLVVRLTPLCAPGHAASRRNKQLVSGGHFVNVLAGCGAEKHPIHLVVGVYTGEGLKETCSM